MAVNAIWVFYRAMFQWQLHLNFPLSQCKQQLSLKNIQERSYGFVNTKNTALNHYFQSLATLEQRLSIHHANNFTELNKHKRGYWTHWDRWKGKSNRWQESSQIKLIWMVLVYHTKTFIIQRHLIYFIILCGQLQQCKTLAHSRRWAQWTKDSFRVQYLMKLKLGVKRARARI